MGNSMQDLDAKVVKEGIKSKKQQKEMSMLSKHLIFISWHL
jgi:hypothetical protein